MDRLFGTIRCRSVFFQGRRYSAHEINAAVDDFAGYLNRNIRSNSPFVMLFAANHIKTLIALFAIIRAGRIVVLADPDIKHLELAPYRETTPPAALIRINRKSAAFSAGDGIEFTDAEIDHDGEQLRDVCMVLYTAADDGYPKAALLTEDNILHSAGSVMKTLGIDDRDTICSLLPFYHIYGLHTGLFTPLLAGGSLVIEDIGQMRNLARFPERVRGYGVTILYSIPMIYQLLSLSKAPRELYRSVRLVVSGGHKLSPAVFDRFYQRTGKEIHEGYGLTEGGICTTHRPGEVIRIDSVGPALEGCEIAVLDDSGERLLPGQVGEVAVRSKQVMKGYFTREGIRQYRGWLRTGDLGRMDEAGYLYLTGLKKRMYNVGGHNVFVRELERMILCHENVVSVRTYGKATESQGDRIHADIVLRNNTREEQERLNRWLWENISSFRIPRKISWHSNREEVA